MKVSEVTANAWLNELFGGGAWLQMHIGDPGDDGTQNFVDASRIFVDFYAATSGSISSQPANGIVPPSTMVWTHFSLWSAVIDGELKWKDTLLTNVPVSSGLTTPLPAGALVLSIG